MTPLRLFVLGPPRVTYGDAVVAFPTRKALALLVYLAIEDGRHSRDKLATLFWPASDRQHGRAMLRYTLTTLRRTLTATHLIVDGDTIALDGVAALDIDMHALGTQPESDEVGRGEFLEGFTLGDTPEFDEWVGLQREVCRQKTERLLAGIVQLHADRGEFVEALEAVRRWVALDPLNEVAHRRLMELHLAAGDQNAALRAYDTCRVLFDRELHVAPAPETESLAERIRLTNPHISPRPPDSMAPPPESPLVSRTEEFITLVQRYHGAPWRRAGGHPAR